jgi:glycine hydroxymethyltransferase
MAEGIFRRAVHGRGDFRVMSAGLGAMDGHPPSQYAVQAVRELGIDISNQCSRMLTADMVQQADYVFGMTHSHVDTVLLLYPQAAEKTFLLREFDETLDTFEKDISDPIGGSYQVYLNCRDQIEQGIASLLQFLEMNDPSMGLAKTTRAGIAIGADHGGYELKEALKKHLAQRGVSVADFGTSSKDSADYPDFARAVAESVARRQSEFGLLVCTTGVGMSMTANKVPGVRAALVGDEQTATLARQHNDANVLCLSGKNTSPEHAARILDAFLNATFEGGRHERRITKMETRIIPTDYRLQAVDPDIAGVIEREQRRQQENIELIASENFTSPAVMEAQGSVLTNKYAEGYPKRRWYGGCEHVDVAEQLAIDRAKRLFGAEHANVQPHSGSGANMAVYFAFLKPGDKMLTMDLSHGGHLTHGNKANFSGKFFEIIHYGVRKEDERIDYDQLAKMAREHKPRMITVGASAYPRIIDFATFGSIAREVDALLLVDMAHIAGLVAGGAHPSPVPHADIVTSTAHKTLRGPRSGFVVCREAHARAIDKQVFPGLQGGPLMHIIAAKAVAFGEALEPAFAEYARRVVANASALGETLLERGFDLVSGGTDNHLLLVDLRSRGDLSGKAAEAALGRARITVNKNTVPGEQRSPFVTSGIRIGTAALSTRGMGIAEMRQVGGWVADVLEAPDDERVASRTGAAIERLCDGFPLYEAYRRQHHAPA